MSEQTVNGINVSKLKETIQAIKGKPSLADFRFRIVNKWQGGGLNQTTVKASYGAGQEFPDRDGKFTMHADEPPILLSGDKAANPVEHLLHAVAACVTTTAVYHAATRHIPLEAVESTLEGELDLRGFLDLDPNVPKGYKNIRMNMHVTGNLSEEQKQEVVQHRGHPILRLSAIGELSSVLCSEKRLAGEDIYLSCLDTQLL